MENKHTPAPWMARPDSDQKGSAWSVYAVSGANRYICTTSGNCEPNAKLIAAAPELLLMLQHAVELMEELKIGDHDVKIYKQVIAKATL
jgi:hypothetical protein